MRRLLHGLLTGAAAASAAFTSASLGWALLDRLRHPLARKETA